MRSQRNHRQADPPRCPHLRARPEDDIKAWITTWNDNPRPFTWTKTADEILSSLAGYLTKVGASQHATKQN